METFFFYQGMLKQARNKVSLAMFDQFKLNWDYFIFLFSFVIFLWFVFFTSQSTAMAMSRRSVDLTTVFPGQT